jgi:TadE-like protein
MDCPKCRREDGAATVEFALVMPVPLLLILALGIDEVSITPFFGTSVSLTGQEVLPCNG